MANNTIYVILSYETLFFYLLCFLNRRGRTFLRRKLLKLVPYASTNWNYITFFFKYTKFNMMLRCAKKNFLSYPQGQNSQNAITCTAPVFNALPVSMGYPILPFLLIDKTAKILQVQIAIVCIKVRQSVLTASLFIYKSK